MEFSVLGPLAVTVDGRPVGLGGRRRRSVLAVLLGTPNRPVSADRLVDTVWGGRPPRTATDNLRLYIHELRRLLGPDRILRHGRGYAVVVRDGELDSERFDALARRGRELLTSAGADAAGAALREGLALWRGDPYADLADLAALAPEIERLREQRQVAVEQSADADLMAGQHSALVPELARRVVEQPLRERLRMQLILALFQAGRVGEALAGYQEARRVLADDLGVDPGPQLNRAHQVVLAGEPPDLPALLGLGPALGPVPGLGPALGPVPGLGPGSGPVAPPAWSAPFLLPPDVPDFTGRADYLARVRRRLAEPAASSASGALAVIGVVGMAGVGKTALAVHAAHQLVDSFPDGQLFVNLRGAESSAAGRAGASAVTDGEAPGLSSREVLARFLRSLGVDSRSIPADPVERAEMYRARLAHRRVLVVLDNAASEEQVRPLLPGAGTCAVLVTSRARLTGVEGARWLDLVEFGAEEAVGLLAEVVEGSRTDRELAEQDLTERDRLGGRRVAAEPEQAAAIVDLCGRLPLAVRVAGARLAARPGWRLGHLAALLTDERHRLGHLTAGDLAVRTSLSLSYDGLSAAGRRLLRRLGLFEVPDFPGWLATAVLGGPADAAAGLLEDLVDAQVLAAVGTDRAGQVRYRFHDLVRLFARERAEVEDAAATRRDALARGLGAWLGVAEQLAAAVPGPCYAPIHGVAGRPAVRHDERAWAEVDPLEWFDAERAALLSVVGQACDLGMDELAFDLAGCLEKYFDVRGMYQDWRATNERVLAVCREAGNLRGEAVMLRGLIDVITWNSQDQPEIGGTTTGGATTGGSTTGGSTAGGSAMGRLREDGTRLLGMFTRLGEPAGRSDAAVIRSWGLTAAGEYESAIEGATWGLDLARRCGHLGGQARANVALALAHSQSGDLPLATSHLRRALVRARELGNPRYLATVLQFLGIAYRMSGDLGLSQGVLQESLGISRAHRDHYAQTLTMIALARLHLARQDPGAGPAAEAALGLGRRYRMGHHLADALAALGEVALAHGRPHDAVVHLEQSVAMWRTRGWPVFLAATLRTLGDAQALIDPGAARRAWAEAEQTLATLGRPTGPYGTYTGDPHHLPIA
jgi:DNA-binding SARP family transcriptional activator/tetratricopeptide (TPR) repeat protein